MTSTSRSRSFSTGIRPSRSAKESMARYRAGSSRSRTGSRGFQLPVDDRCRGVGLVPMTPSILAQDPAQLGLVDRRPAHRIRHDQEISCWRALTPANGPCRRRPRSCALAPPRTSTKIASRILGRAGSAATSTSSDLDSGRTPSSTDPSQAARMRTTSTQRSTDSAPSTARTCSG